MFTFVEKYMSGVREGGGGDNVKSYWYSREGTTCPWYRQQKLTSLQSMYRYTVYMACHGAHVIYNPLGRYSKRKKNNRLSSAFLELEECRHPAKGLNIKRALEPHHLSPRKPFRAAPSSDVCFCDSRLRTGIGDDDPKRFAINNKQH